MKKWEPAVSINPIQPPLVLGNLGQYALASGQQQTASDEVPMEGEPVVSNNGKH